MMSLWNRGRHGPHTAAPVLGTILLVRRVPVVEITHDLHFAGGRRDEDELHWTPRREATAGAAIGGNVVPLARGTRGASSAYRMTGRERDGKDQCGRDARQDRPHRDRSRSQYARPRAVPVARQRAHDVHHVAIEFFIHPHRSPQLHDNSLDPTFRNASHRSPQGAYAPHAPRDCRERHSGALAIGRRRA